MFEVLDRRSGTALLLGLPDPDLAEDRSVKADWLECPVDFLEGDGPLMRYTYDFGDDWYHTVVFEDYTESEAATSGPICIGGANACPPEDCGGAEGYMQLLEALGDDTHPEHEEMTEWGGRFVRPLRVFA